MAFIRRCLPILARTFNNYAVKRQDRHIHRWVAPTLVELKRRENKLGGKKTSQRNTYLEWNLEAEIYAFAKRLHEEFDSDLLLQAFTDRSFVIKEEMKQKELGLDISMKDNRELAEEGEKFMKEYIQQYLEAVLPKFPLEGIAAVRLHLTSENLLSNVSMHLGTKDIILSAEYPVDSHTLAKTLKAIVGALIKSSGEERAAYFVRDFIITQLQGKDINDFWPIEDPWSMLKDLLAKDGCSLEPRLIGEVGRTTLLACYRVGLYIEKKMISSGFGESVDIAKEMAAREALKNIFGTEDHMKPINFKLQGIPKSDAQSRHQIPAS